MHFLCVGACMHVYVSVCVSVYMVWNMRELWILDWLTLNTPSICSCRHHITQGGATHTHSKHDASLIMCCSIYFARKVLLL